MKLNVVSESANAISQSEHRQSDVSFEDVSAEQSASSSLTRDMFHSEAIQEIFNQYGYSE